MQTVTYNNQIYYVNKVPEKYEQNNIYSADLRYKDKLKIVFTKCLRWDSLDYSLAMMYDKNGNPWRPSQNEIKNALIWSVRDNGGYTPTSDWIYQIKVDGSTMSDNLFVSAFYVFDNRDRKHTFLKKFGTSVEDVYIDPDEILELWLKLASKKQIKQYYEDQITDRLYFLYYLDKGNKDALQMKHLEQVALDFLRKCDPDMIRNNIFGSARKETREWKENLIKKIFDKK